MRRGAGIVRRARVVGAAGHRRPPAAHARGFTLFEVLAAVLVLALVYTWLASMNIEGLRSEGTSRRRLEASLIADAALATIEEGIALGAPPVIGSTEEELGDFRVTVAAAPLDILPFLGEDALPPEGVTESLLTLPNSGDAPFLSRVDVAVRWIEGLDEFEVHRTTFAYDAQALEGLFPTEEQEGPPLSEEEQREATLEEMRQQLEALDLQR